MVYRTGRDRFQWTPERNAYLIESRAGGVSTRVMAERLGTTKGTVIAQTRRLKMPLMKDPVGKKHE